MANSAINISANAQEVINLRKRIDELKAALSSMRRSTDPAAYDKLNRELQTSSIRYNRLVGDIQRYVVAQQQAERATSKSSDGLTDLLKKGAALAGITFGAEKIRELGMEIVRVHGEMQQLNIAFSTMLKSQEKADVLMSSLKQFAVDTPFGLMDSAKGAKQLLAYGTQAENIVSDLKMLGNVASGVSAPLGDIVYLYGTLRSQGRAYAVDIRQFAGRGIPIYAELAKVLKVNVDQVNELVSAGKVGFPEVEQAFKNMTSGGGMFEGLMEKQTASVTGQIEKLKDNIQFMFDAIGTSSEGAIYGAIDGASTLVENYETVGKVLLGLIATYGTYRTAVMLTTTVETARISIIDKLLTAQSMENISKLNLTKGTAAYAAAVQAELAVQQKKELAALKEIGFEARRNYVKEQGLLLSAQQAVIDAKATGASGAKITALQAEASARGKSLATARAEMIAAAQNIATKQADIVATTTSTASTNLLTIAKTRLVAISKSLWATMAANPLALFAAGAIALTYSVYQLVTATSEQEVAQNSLNKTLEDAKKKKEDLSTNTNSLVQVVNDETKTVFEQIEAYQKLQGIYPDYLSNMTRHEFQALSLTEQQKLLNQAINDFDLKNQDEILKKFQDLYSKIQNAQSSFDFEQYIGEAVDALDIPFWTKIKMNNKDVQDMLQQHIKSLQDQKKQREENLKQAEFELKPEREKREIYQSQINDLKGQEAAIINNIIATGEFVRNIDGTISPVDDLKTRFTDITGLLNTWNKNPFSVHNVFANANPTVDMLITKLKTLNQEKLKLEGKLAPEIIPAINKATLDEQVKDFKEYEEGLAPDILKKLRGGESIVTLGLSKERLSELQDIQDKYKKLGDAAKKAKEDVKIYEDPDKAAKRQDKLNSKAETAAEKARKTAQKVLDDQLKLDNDKAKASLDARNQELENQQALLNLQEDGFKKEQKQAEINHQKELLSVDKRAQELIEAKQKAERDAWDIKNPNPKTTYANKTVSSSDLLLGQQSELNNSRDIANRTQIKANADLLKNLLEKYQDFNTKKIAVDKQYNKDLQALESQRTNDNSESINRSISQLKKQYKESISAINIEELRESIDWQTVFGDIDRVSSQSIENLRSKFKEYASEAGKNLAPTDMKTLTDAIDQLDKKYAELKPNKAFTDSFNDYKAATDNVKRLRQELEVIKSGGNITIGAEYDKESGKMTTVVKTQTQAEKDLTDAQNKRRQSLISLGTALQGYVSKSQQYLDLANETVSTLEAFGVKVPEGVSKTLEGLGQISSGMDDVSKGLTSMNPVLIAQGGIKALGGLANAVQGIFGKRNKAADDTKRLQDVTEKVSVANDAINSLLEKRIELIKESTAAERQHLSVLTNESLDAYQDYYDEQFNRLLGNDLYGKKGKNNNLSVEDVMKMYGLSSPEDFAKWWQSGGYGALTLQGYDLRDKDKYDSWASAYMDMIDKRKELAQTMDEEATQISFDSFRDSFLDTLSDMDSSSKDFAENFEGYLQKAMLNSLLNEKYQERIKNLYSMFSDYNADGNIDESEYKKLQDYEKQLTDDMIADRDRLKKSFGWDSSTSQSASSGYSTSMSQDTGEAIEGRMTAMQMNLISIDGNVARIAEWSQPFDMKYNVDVLTAPLSALSESCQRIELMLEQNRNIAIQSYYELKDINKQTKELYPIRIGIDTMNKTLSNL